jgi:hypothetical protein
MRADLLHAQASIDWAKSQLPSLDERVSAWLKDNVEIVRRDPDPSSPNYVIVADPKEPLPLAFVVEVGAYINCIRSSLDLLAVALAHRYGMAKPESANFPVAASEKEFVSGGYKGSEFVKGLPDAERAKIEALKPYCGGNQMLWALHRLDILRKHKRLVETMIRPAKFSITGWGLSHGFTPLPAFIRGVDQETVLGLLDKRQRAQINFTPTIAFDEPDLSSLPAVAGLTHFAKLATEIIGTFDNA